MRASSPIRDTALVAVFAALVAAASITPGVPVGPVPITLQTFAVLLTGLVLGPARGFAAVALYLVVGLGGLPVFAQGGSGLGSLAGGGAGYLLSFPLAALLVGVLSRQVLTRLPQRWHALAFCVGAYLVDVVVILGLGAAGMMVNLKWGLVEATVYQVRFLPGDLAKAVLAGTVAAMVHRAFPALQGRPVGTVTVQTLR